MLANKKFYRIPYNKAHIAAFYYQKRNAYITLAKKMSKNIYINEGLFSKAVIKEYKDKWNVIDPFVSTIFFKLYSSLRGEVDICYIPDYLYSFPVDHVLQNHRYSAYYENKALYNQWLADYSGLFPRTYLRKIDGICFDEHYCRISNVEQYIRDLEETQLVAKPSIDTASGKGVSIYRKNESTGQFCDERQVDLLARVQRERDIVIQERVKQSVFMNSVNSSSINTIRVVTYRSVTTEDIHVMQVVIKRGKEGLFVDNLNSGGSFVEVARDGHIAKYGLTKWGKKIPFKCNEDYLPQFESICSVAREVAARDLINRQLYFDMFIDDCDKVRIMEINYSPHPTIQAVCGPAFAEFTDELIEYVRKTEGSLVRLIPVRALI